MGYDAPGAVGHLVAESASRTGKPGASDVVGRRWRSAVDATAGLALTHDPPVAVVTHDLNCFAASDVVALGDHIDAFAGDVGDAGRS